MGEKIFMYILKLILANMFLAFFKYILKYI